MPDLVFDEKNGFERNLEIFLSQMEAEDKEMGKILRDSIDELKGASDERSRNAARTRFNTSVVAKLEETENEEDE